MAIQTATMRTALAAAYATNAPYVTLTSTVPSGSAGTEITPITRSASNWGTAATSAVSATPAAFSLASGASVAGAQFMSALTAGTYMDGGAVTAQTFSSAGTYTLTATYTQS